MKRRRIIYQCISTRKNIYSKLHLAKMLTTNLMQFLLVLLAGFGIFAIPLDLAGQEKQRKITAGYLKGLKEPTQKILCNINLISRNTDVLQIDAKKDHDYIKTYRAEFQDKCNKQFLHVVEDSRFVNAMKIIQGLVGLTQDMQISESRLNVFDETPLVRDYRHIEYDLRDLVESEMRKVAFEILDHQNYRNIPAYSVGGLYDADKTKADTKDTTRSRNRVKLDQIEECLKLFIVNVLSQKLELCTV